MSKPEVAQMADNLACPIDGLALACCHAPGQTSQMRCANGHAFDIARQGYINLLGVQDKRSKDPGDTREMIAARSRILAAGLYLPLARKLATMVSTLLPPPLAVRGRAICLLDAGCGEGYYLEHCLVQARTYTEVQGIGLDISKWAVMAAARRHVSGVAWLVGSNRNIPVLPGSVDVIVCGFGFPDFPAFRQALKPGGYVIMLDPAENHLLELREVIYPVLKPYRGNDFSRALEAGFSLDGRERLTCTGVSISPQQIRDVLVMSPHLYKATAEGKAAAFALPALDITLDANFSVLQLPPVTNAG